MKAAVALIAIVVALVACSGAEQPTQEPMVEYFHGMELIPEHHLPPGCQRFPAKLRQMDWNDWINLPTGLQELALQGACMGASVDLLELPANCTEADFSYGAAMRVRLLVFMEQTHERMGLDWDRKIDLFYRMPFTEQRDELFKLCVSISGEAVVGIS